MIWRGRLLTRRFGNTWQTYNPVTNDWVNLYTSGYSDFDNNGGGGWYKYINIPITTTPSEYAQYKIVIDPTNVTVYAADGTQEAQGAVASDFWDNVQSDGSDIRVFDQAKDQLYFWIESWDYSGQNAVIWVKLPAGSSELNIAYGNPSATKSSYLDGEQTFELFDDFEDLPTSTVGTVSIDSGGVSGSCLYLGSNGGVTFDFTNSGFRIGFELYAKYTVSSTSSSSYMYILGGDQNYDSLSSNTTLCGNPAIFTTFKKDTYDYYDGSAFNQIYDSSANTWYKLHYTVYDSNYKVDIYDVDGNILTSMDNIPFRSDTSDEKIDRIIIFSNPNYPNPGYIDVLKVYKLTDPADFGTPQILEF